MYSPTIDKLIKELKKLPSVGQHTAERFVFNWLKAGKREVGELLLALKEVMDKVKSCETCWDFSETNPCPICRDPARDKTTICVVSDPQSIPVIERTGEFKGVYHILRGLVDPNKDNAWQDLKLKEFFSRLDKEPKPKEIILALNPDLPGETTMMYLEREIKNINNEIKVSRLARGLPMGSDLQYADEITLGSAFKNRSII